MPRAIDDDEVEAQIDEDVDDNDEEMEDHINDDDSSDELVVSPAASAVHLPEADDVDDDNEEDEEAIVAEDVDVDDLDEDKDDEDDEVLAAVVVEDGDDVDDDDANSSIMDDVSVVAEPVVTVVETPKRKSKSPVKASVKRSNNKPGPKSNPYKQTTTSLADAKKSGNKKKRPSTGSIHVTSSSTSKAPAAVVSSKSNAAEELYKSLPAKKVTAARDARAMLRETVVSLPAQIAETQVRSFGRVPIQSLPLGTSKLSSINALASNNPFVTATTLYPIGFSCDRYELSPVHGRILKLRCTILDGRSIKASQKRGDFPVQTDLPDGPVFRIMWGRGIDEDDIQTNGDNNNTEYPFDPFTHSAPIISTGSTRTDALIKDAVKSTKRSTITPKVGMRVKVMCDKDIYFTGTVATVSEPKTITNGGKKRKRYNVMIHYDDGLKEEMLFPDPDIELMTPAIENEIGPDGEVELTELNDKPVYSVVGKTPLQAWGKVLLKMGLVDEIMVEKSMETIELTKQDVKLRLENRRSSSFVDLKKRDDLEGGETSPVQPSTPVSCDDNREDKRRFEEGMDESIQSTSDREPPSEEEIKLRAKLEALLSDLSEAKEKDRNATIDLANARIYDLGPFLCNPFPDDEAGRAQEQSWLSIAVKKEKTRMGSTGNKRKVVSAVDILERNNTFYNQDIESLLEGLPGSEFCESYFFQSSRASGPGNLNRAWIQEAQIRNENEAMLRVQRSKISEIKDEQDLERDLKRKQRDDDRDIRKRQKLSEEEERKKMRADERLSRLEIQINERLFKEAAMQREKVVISLLRILSKEFSRRRKAAESIATQVITDGAKFAHNSFKPLGIESLPKPSQAFNEDTVRVWNFMSTFKDFFLQKGFVSEIPTLRSLQSAIDCIQGHSSVDSLLKEDAVASLTNLSVALCKPLAASLTRSLFASLIALNPALQKDFGAAFFNGVNASAATELKGDDGEPRVVGSNAAPPTDCLIPVNSLTWQEVARLAFLGDALGELGLSKHEVAHMLRGYRSAGHPNSKESRRLRKTEDFFVAVLRQKITEGRLVDDSNVLTKNRSRISIPCQPLHSQRDAASLKETPGAWPWQSSNVGQNRLSVGLINCLSLSNTEFKELCTSRENYMEDSLFLKEEMERLKHKEAGGDEDDEDDEDEEDDDYDDVEKLSKRSKKRSNTSQIDAKSSPETDISNDDDGIKNGNMSRIGKETPYDDFCADIPTAPDLLRRCLAVLRTLAGSGPAEPFLYPVDPQSNPAYYDIVLRPMCLREAGKQLNEAAESFNDDVTDERIEEVVLQFGRNIRLIEQNCMTYTNAGPTVIAASSELLRLFERLFFDWVLAPEHLLPALEDLDDDKCVEHHSSDEESTVLFCDGCEGKYNIFRLSPPLSEIPKGDWYCPRCISGRWYGSVDPRIGKVVKKLGTENSCIESVGAKGRIEKCLYSVPITEKVVSTLVYRIKFESGVEEIWSLNEVDLALQKLNTPVPPIRSLRAVAESPGYGSGVDYGLRRDVVPAPLIPNVSDSSAQVALSSSVFRDTISAAGILLISDPQDMTAAEWLRLLALLVMKCSSSDVMQNVITAMENEAAEAMLKSMDKVKKATVFRIQEILPDISSDDDDIEEVQDIGILVPDSPLVEAAGTRQRELTPSPAPSSQFMNQTMKAPPVVVDAGVVEFVDEMDIEVGKENAVSAEITNVSVEKKTSFSAALNEKAKRQKTIEESFAAFCIREQMKPAVASFEEDLFSSVVDSCLPSTQGLSYKTLKCNMTTCQFCGLTDLALGSPLVRVPNEDDWIALMPHVSRNRRTHLVADLNGYDSASEQNKKLVSLTIRLDGELLSFPESRLSEIKDGGMLEFIPRSEKGCSDELKFRYESGLPFVTGTMSAHETCAVAAHNARKEQIVQEYKANEAERFEKEAGMYCGRTLEIGRDNSGRSYWKFASDPNSLFVCVEVENVTDDKDHGTWYQYQSPEIIASLITNLGKDPITKELQRLYPDSMRLIHDCTWQELVLKSIYPSLMSDFDSNVSSPKSSKSLKLKVEGGYDPYHVGEDVLVESVSTMQLWDATVVAHSKKVCTDSSKYAVVDGYKVQYKNWSNRFMQWVKPSRVIEPSDHNRSLQEELLDERAKALYGLPNELSILYAKDYLFAKDRARGSSPLPDFGRIAHPSKDNPTTSERTLAIVKAGLLAIEAALPVGCIDNRATGPWRNKYATQWKLNTVNAEGPAALMQCVILLEDMISEEWFKEDVGYVRSCLPARWKAITEASPGSLAIRLILFDRAIIYSNVDAKRYAARKRAPR